MSSGRLSEPSGRAPSTRVTCTRLAGHGAAITQFAFASDDRRLLTASKDTTLRVWSVDSGESVMTVATDSPIWNVRVVDSERAIILRDDGVVVTVCIDPESAADLLTRRLHEAGR